MTGQEPNAHSDDLPLEGSESEAVVGGQVSRAAIARADREIARLEKEGYIQDACTVDGTLMYNPHTRLKKMVRF